MKVPRPLRARLALTAAIVTLALLLGLCASARPAAAAPLEKTLDLAELQVLLSKGPVTGYFRTVAQGDTISEIPMTVLSIVGKAGLDGALIMFQADMTDPIMARIGNIAHGMSGSPLFVQSGGEDHLIGALSYGDIFTLGGLGLATPIEYMIAIENNHEVGPAAAAQRPHAARPADRMRSVTATTLAKPVRTTAGVVRRVVVAQDPRVAAHIPRPAGTVVFTPLEALQIGGLPYGSAVYKAVAAALEKRGHTVLRGMGTGPDGWDPDFTTELKGGAACAAMYTNGDLWAGAFGTVTYVDGERLMAFGHPLDWAGPTALFLNNIYIDGIWGSGLASYKLGEPGAARGTVTQDRGSGIGARLDRVPDAVPLTSHASMTTDVSRSASSSTLLVQKWADTPDGAFLAAAAVAVPILRASDQYLLVGSGQTVTTVHVTDGTHHYTVQRANLWDDAFDVQYSATGDVQNILMTLTANPDGIAPATIESVDLQATLSDERLRATIADAQVPGGLKVGDNTVEVTLYGYGVADPQTVGITLTIPEGMPTSGTLTVGPATDTGSASDGPPMVDRATVARKTLGQVVEALNETPTNDQVKVTFTPAPPDTPLASTRGGQPVVSTSPVTALAHTDWVVSGVVTKPTALISLQAVPGTVLRGEGTVLQGGLAGITADTTVALFKRVAGTADWRLVQAALPVPAGGDTAGSFSLADSRLGRNTEYRVVWAGDAQFVGGTVDAIVLVRASVHFRARELNSGAVWMTARLLPADTGGRVAFERREGKRWVHIATARVRSEGTAGYRWSPAHGTYRLRARFLGSSVNAPVTSRSLTLTVY